MNLRNIAFWLMTTVVIAMSIYVIFWTKQQSYECVSNPYTYSIKLLEKANDADVMCTCSALKAKGSVTVILTRDGFHPEVSLDKNIKDFIIPNLSNVEKSFIDPSSK
jgi:hypothetical protein